METKYFCPHCGTEFQQGDYDYNYDYGILDFICPFCDWEGTEEDVVTEEDDE